MAIRIDSRRYERVLAKRDQQPKAPFNATRSDYTRTFYNNNRPNNFRRFSAANSMPIRSTTANTTFNKEVTLAVNLRAAFVPSSARITRRGRLTPEEYQRRKDHNLCLYCADKNHQVAKCPVVPSQQSNTTLPSKN